MLMKKIFSVLIVLILVIATAMTTNDSKALEQTITVDKPAKFTQGDFIQYVTKNLNLTKEEIGKGGEVVVQFVVNTDGDVEGVKFLKSYSKMVDSKVFQVLKSMPKWIPAIKEGKNVASHHTLPILLKPA